METKRLFVVDAMALAFRSFYAFQNRPLTREDGTPTSAVFGSALFIHKLIEEQNPDYMVIASDCKAPTFRHEMYPAYKANRSEMPEDLAAQIEPFYEMFNAMGIPVIKQPGFEADDVIGTIAKKYGAPGLEVVIVSSDKDLMQLVNDNVTMLAPKSGQEIARVDRDAVFKKFSCSPEQVVDCLALMGDSSDNVPGVAGIGEKGAAALISEYGSLDNIFAKIDEIANTRHRNALAKGREDAEMSRDLVTLKCDMELPIEDLEDMVLTPGAWARESLLQFYQTMEFRNLQQKVRDKLSAYDSDVPHPADMAEGIEPQAPRETNYSDIASQVNYLRVETATDLDRMISALERADHFALDTETTGLDVHGDPIIGASFSVKAGEAYYLPLHEKHSPFLKPSDALAHLRSFLEASTATKIGHNLKFDLQIFAAQDINVAGPFFDTFIGSHLLDPLAGKHGLDACCLRHLSYRKIPTSTLIGEKGEHSMLEADVHDVTRYACEDADFTLRLGELFMQQIREQGLEELATEIEMPLIPILARMERGGVTIAPESLGTLSEELAVMLEACRAKIFAIAGEEFNIQSPKQLQKIMFEKLKVHEQLGVKRLKKTKSGFSTDESVLRKLSGHPLCSHILEYRGYAKLKNTYVDVLPTLIHPQTGRVHTNFHQTVTATGRLSSSGPNLQNIPIRTDLGKKVREAFVADEGHDCIISADYSQIELRLLAHIAQEKNLANAFRDGEDIHTSTAARLLGKPAEEITEIERSRAKAINFGILYGMGPKRLAADTGISEAAAAEFIERYFSAYPAINDFVTKTVQDARERGFTETLGGRRRPMPDLDNRNGRIRASAENIAVNTPIQGSAADLIKKAMINLDEKLQAGGYKTRMILQVHDELVFSCPAEEKESIQEVIRDSMETAMTLTVPTTVSLGVGMNWREAH